MDRSSTKLVCTIGPATVDRIAELVGAGMDVARINFSHGTPEDHRAYVHAVRSAAHSARRSVAVMADLPGPKIRLGRLRDDAVTLETGATFVLRPASAARSASPQSDEPTVEPATDAGAEQTTAVTAGATPEVTPEAAPDGTAETATAEEAPADVAPEPTPVEPAEELGDANGASVSEPGLAGQLQVGDRVLLADGAAELRVTEIGESDVTTTVVNGGTIRSRSGVNVPSERLVHVGLTDADRAAVPRALELRVDLIAQSFVRSAEDVRALRTLLPVDGPRVVAKIETRAALDSLDGILREADGIMVARGDLGVDIPFEEVPLAQKDMVRRASEADRFTIVATQMLESMTGAPRPTRAEASDVANAVLDGADAVMLSAETAIGKYPVEALQAMARICAATDPLADRQPAGDLTRVDAAHALPLAAHVLVGLVGADALWCFTRTGATAETLSMTRPGVPIVAFTLSPIVARRLAVRRGVLPMVLPAMAGRGEPLIGRMEAAWRQQRNRPDLGTVVLVTTSRNPAGINRLEIHRLPTSAPPKAEPTARRDSQKHERRQAAVPVRAEPQPLTEPEQGASADAAPPAKPAEPQQGASADAAPPAEPAEPTEPAQPVEALEERSTEPV